MTDMGNKVLVSVAPVAATDKVIIPEKIAEDVYDCYKAGAAMVHLHVRDREGNLTPDMTLLEETLAMIRRDSDIVIEVSTGGGLQPDHRRAVCAPLLRSCGSLFPERGIHQPGQVCLLQPY